MKNQFPTSLKNADTMSFTKTLKGFYLILSLMFISMLHMAFAFAKTNLRNRMSPHPVVSTSSLTPDAPNKSIYDSLQLGTSGLNREAFEYAQKGWKKLVEQGRVNNQSVMTIVDFSQPSSQKRLYILDMKNYKVLFNTLVAHGKNSGQEWASSFSNQNASYKSSPGFYITRDTYIGENGLSLRLEGVEKGINDNAYQRAIVIHGADYVNQSLADHRGFIGRSHGCPAVPRKEAKPIINTIKDGACLFVYAPTAQYISRSSLIA